MVSVLITGTNRGIGLELVKKFARHSDPPKIILATCRNPEAALDLIDVSKKHNNVKILELDVSKIDSYPVFADKVRSTVKENGLNVLINNAAVMSNFDKPYQLPSYQQYLDTFQINTFAPVFLSQALLPLIKTAAAANSNQPIGIKRAAVINISSLLGSVSINEIKGVHVDYSESKAALNSATRSLSKNVKEFGILALALHPGWNWMNLKGAKRGEVLAPDESAEKLMKVIYGLTEKDNDSFIDWDGETIPW